MQFPKGPGAAFTAEGLYATTLLLPVVLSQLGGYDLTYGSLAGVMIALIFFFVIGLGVVIGAELNAALAEFPDEPEATDSDRTGDRKSAVEGKSVSVRVDMGGRRIIKKNKVQDGGHKNKWHIDK